MRKSDKNKKRSVLKKDNDEEKDRLKASKEKSRKTLKQTLKNVRLEDLLDEELLD